MRAAVYEGTGPSDVLHVRELPDPGLGSDDALVEVAYAGLNRADILERAGGYGKQEGGVSYPGLEFAGTVRAVGERVRSLHAGARVCGLVAAGAHATMLATNALTLATVPDEMPLDVAAAIPEAVITAYDALFTRGAYRTGDTVLVHAAGSGVGLAAIALAKAAGAFVVGTSRTPEKLERAREHGLDAAVLAGGDFTAAAKAALGPRGADVILDFVGAAYIETNLALLASGGRIVQIGTLGGAAAALNLGALMGKRGTIVGTMLRHRPLDEKIALARDVLEQRLLPMFARGVLRAEIDGIFDLDAIRDAHARMESNANFGKILIRMR